MNRNGKEAEGNIRTDMMNTDIEDEGEHGTGERKEICSGT